MIHHVKATSFADPADIAAFRLCKNKGGTDKQCFKVGDNGIGCWGDDTATTAPACALPPDDWTALAKPRGTLVRVSANGRSVVCRLLDTMPWKARIRNGAGIDLNPAACASLGLRPPVSVPATWEFI